MAELVLLSVAAPGFSAPSGGSRVRLGHEQSEHALGIEQIRAYEAAYETLPNLPVAPVVPDVTPRPQSSLLPLNARRNG